MRIVTILRWFVGLAGLFAGSSALADGMSPLASGEILRGSYTQERVLQGFTTPLRSAGSFVLAPGQGLIWRAETPFAVTTLMTGKGLAQQSDGVTTLNLPTSHAPFMAGLYEMLTGALAGDWRGLDRDFSVEQSTDGGKWNLRLKPRHDAPSAAMPIIEIRVTGGDYVETVEIEKQGGDHDTLTFSGQQRLAGALAADEKALLDAVGGP
ncbi:outer membrane lipoprotein carrier protein LolA [Dongia sp.]|uniref:LolA family protein n=1 Tax=Dongia sp. TaxID=1977262 RepID=UPI0035AEE3D7